MSKDTKRAEPSTEDNPTSGPAMSDSGAQPSGSEMDHWATAQPNPDATKPGTMPRTASRQLPGETEDREPV